MAQILGEGDAALCVRYVLLAFTLGGMCVGLCALVVSCSLVGG